MSDDELFDLAEREAWPALIGELGKVDVGGSESFLQSSATVHGTSSENAYLIEGMDVSNLDGNGSQAIMYLDPYVFEETNYQMGSAGTAVSSKGGLIFNMITRTGPTASMAA